MLLLRGRDGRLSPSRVAFLLALVVLLPTAARGGHFPDEDQYGWTGAYYAGRLAHLDFRTSGADPIEDPGWAPDSYWALTQPMGTRLLYGLALGIAHQPAPARPFQWEDINPRQPERVDSPDTRLNDAARLTQRVVAVLAVALAMALLASRLGWWGTIGSLALLALPTVSLNLALGWAEGPLILGLALCIAGYGRRWFGAAAGLAAAFKLTGLIAWPLLLIPGCAGRGRWGWLRGVPVALAVWTLLEPPSWFSWPFLGPAYLLPMFQDRAVEYGIQTAAEGGPLGLFMPTRYLVPVTFLLLAALAAVAARLHARLGSRSAAFRQLALPT